MLWIEVHQPTLAPLRPGKTGFLTPGKHASRRDDATDWNLRGQTSLSSANTQLRYFFIHICSSKFFVDPPPFLVRNFHTLVKSPIGTQEAQIALLYLG